MADKKPLEESPVGRAVSDQAQEQNTVQTRGQWRISSIQRDLFKLYHLQALIVIQKTVRMGLARRKYKPRYEMLMKINQLSAQLQKLGATGKNLKTEKVKDSSMM